MYVERQLGDRLLATRTGNEQCDLSRQAGLNTYNQTEPSNAIIGSCPLTAVEAQPHSGTPRHV